MSNLSEKMTKVIENCDILLDNQLFSRELLLRSFAQFLTATADKEKHNVGIILHTGSLLFDALAIVYGAVSNLVLNDTDTNDIILSLEVGDTVLYGKKKKARYTFEGVVSLDKASGQEYILLIQGDDNKNYVPKSMWHHISPYQGKSTHFDGRGIRKQSDIREKFYTDVLGFEEKDIPSITDISTVIVLPRDYADRLINGLTIKFGEHKIGLLELVTASYFTENNEYYYTGNTGKTEPVLKLTGKLSVARKLLLAKTGNRNIGLMVMGNDIISRGITELPELLKRKSIQYVYVSVNIDSEHGPLIINECENLRLFACTKDFLLSNSSDVKIKNKYTTELVQQVNAIINQNIEPIIFEGHFSWLDYKEFKKNMFAIKNSDFDTPENDMFIIQAYSLMNLFITAVFKITELERLIKENTLGIISPAERLRDLEAAIKNFPNHLQEKAKSVLDFIETAYLLLSEKSEKEDFLRKYLRNNRKHKIAIIVPKAYYATVLKESGLYDIMDRESLLHITTANGFDNTQLYDDIICVGDFEGKRFNPFRCRAAMRIITLLFSFESNLYKHKLKKAVQLEKIYNEHSEIKYVTNPSYDELYYDDNESNAEIEDIEAITAEVDEYINHLNEIADLKSLGIASSTNGNTTESVAIAFFETGERAFLTKMYKAYVFDDNSGEVREMGVENLREGDSIVFTQNNAETRDIVDDMLAKLIASHKLSPEIFECYDKSKYWKFKLIEYMRKTQKSAKDIAKAMIENGVQVQEITIRSWLDEDDHTVGPRDKESIRQIALLVEDDELFEHYEQFFEACTVIRRIRREILKTIGEAIISKLSGKTPVEGTLIADIFDRIDSLARVLRLESITFVTRNLPMNATNRPITMKE